MALLENGAAGPVYCGILNIRNFKLINESFGSRAGTIRFGIACVCWNGIFSGRAGRQRGGGQLLPVPEGKQGSLLSGRGLRG